VGEHLRREIESLKRMIISLSTVVEENVRKAVRSIDQLDAKLAAEVIERDRDIDQSEVDVEEECLKILALHQPVAIDLRYIIAVLKINNDLERIGDLAVNIAERTLFLCEQDRLDVRFDFAGMSSKTLSMLKRSLDSLVNMDTQTARGVLVSDDEVDEMNRQMCREIADEIKREPEQTESLMRYFSASRHLERIADYATNIAEDVIYMMEGTIVRHGAGGEFQD
jgi:phosphate transport system protein